MKPGAASPPEASFWLLLSLGTPCPLLLSSILCHSTQSPSPEWKPAWPGLVTWRSLITAPTQEEWDSHKESPRRQSSCVVIKRRKWTKGDQNQWTSTTLSQASAQLLLSQESFSYLLHLLHSVMTLLTFHCAHHILWLHICLFVMFSPHERRDCAVCPLLYPCNLT